MEKLAGIPDSGISRAKEILKSLVESAPAANHGGVAAEVQDFEDDSGQLSLLPISDNEIIRRLKELDVNTLTPIEAMQVLYELAKQASTY